MKKTLQTLATAFTALVIISVAQSAPAHAASFNVAVGNDETTTNSSCSLSEAIGNINDQAATNGDCPAGDGVNDTINIPAGTITLTADLPTITESVTITGAGMGQTIIDGGSAYSTFSSQSSAPTQFNISDMKITAFDSGAIALSNGELIVNKVEVDGAGMVSNSIVAAGMLVGSISSNEDVHIVVNDSYIHGISVSTGSVGNLGIGMLGSGGAKVTADINRVTVTDISNNGGNAYGIIFTGGVFGNLTPNTFLGKINNATISNINSTVGLAGGVGMSNASGGTGASADLEINNSTIIGTKGAEPLPGLHGGGLIVFGATDGVSSVVNNTINAQNLLLADNITASVGPSNCMGTLDFSAALGADGAGTSNSTIVSTGGNLSSDITCSAYFNKPSDQNNLTNLGSTLGLIKNNGGLIPTIALLEGSPAIDSGITIPTLISDARGSVRPQGLAYDSGAYESPFTTAVSPGAPATAGGATANLADTGQSLTTLMAFIALMLALSGSALVASRH